MKKLLLGLSCLLAMSISLQASADAKSEAAKRAARAARTAQKAAAGARATVGEGQAATKLADGVRAAGTGAAAESTADVMFGQNAQGAEVAYKNQQCDLSRIGDEDTTAAMETELVNVNTCLAELSAPAKRKFGRAINRAGIYLKGVGQKFSTALKAQKEQAQQAWWRGLDVAIDGVVGGEVDYNEAKKRARQMCTSCPDLNVFCAI